MKSAAGEANLTVIAIILITVVVSVATPIIMSLMKRQVWRACCTDRGGIVRGTNCAFINEGDGNTVVPGRNLIEEGTDRCIEEIPRTEENNFD